MIAARDREIAQRLKDLLLGRDVPVVETIVFGSRGRGDAAQHSDLDVLVLIARRDSEMRETIRHCAWEIGFDEGLFIQTVVMTKDEAESSPQRSSLLMLAVGREGIKV